MLYWCIIVKIYVFITTFHSNRMVKIKLTRPSLIPQLSMRAKKKAWDLTNSLWGWPDKELVLIQVNCLIFTIYAKISRLDYRIISVFYEQSPTLCYRVPILSKRQNLGHVLPSLPIMVSVHRALRAVWEKVNTAFC